MSDVERLTLTLASELDTDALGLALAEFAVPDLVMGFIGPLGAGKTRLTRAFAEAMGVDPAMIASPTFVLIHEYQGRLPIYHFDTYRLNDPDAFDDLGASEYFNAGGICIVEWADRVLDRLPTDALLIHISPTGPTTRAVVIEGTDLSRLRSILKGRLPR